MGLPIKGEVFALRLHTRNPGWSSGLWSQHEQCWYLDLQPWKMQLLGTICTVATLGNKQGKGKAPCCRQQCMAPSITHHFSAKVVQRG